jgi:hypothetical protein
MANERPKLSVGGEQQQKDNPPVLIPNDPAPTTAQALKNSQAQVDKAARGK